MKAITTKYLPVTNFKGGRIKAFDCDNNSVTIPFNYGLNQEDRHKEAAIELCKKMGWDTELIGGSIKDGYVFVFKNQ